LDIIKVFKSNKSTMATENKTDAEIYAEYLEEKKKLDETYANIRKEMWWKDRNIKEKKEEKKNKMYFSDYLFSFLGIYFILDLINWLFSSKK